MKTKIAWQFALKCVFIVTNYWPGIRFYLFGTTSKHLFGSHRVLLENVPEFWDSNQGLFGCRSGVLNNDNCLVFSHFSSFTREEMCVLNAILIALRSGSPSQLKKSVELETFVLICLSMRGSRSIMIPSRPSQHRVIHSISPQTALLCQTNDLAPPVSRHHAPTHHHHHPPPIVGETCRLWLALPVKRGRRR